MTKRLLPAFLYEPRPDRRNRLLSLGESGPGYQLIRITGPRRPGGGQGRVPPDDYIVFNAELFVPLTRFREEAEPRRGQLTYEVYKDALAPTVVAELAGKEALIPDSQPRSTFVVEGVTSAGQRFYRFSAYYLDRRITARGGLKGLLDGRPTYLTSALDRRLVNTGLGAVGRYALYSPLPAIFVYEVRVGAGIPFQAGTVRPANGQAGGGVEVVLGAKLPAGSVVLPPTVIPFL